MLNENIKYEDELSNLINGLADSVLEMSDEEIEEEFREDGDTDVETVRQILLNSVKAFRQKSLRQARENYKQKLLAFQDTQFDIPESPDEKRNLIQAMLGDIAAQNQSRLTAQFRDFKDIPDEDLDGILQQIYALQLTEQNDENS